MFIKYTNTEGNVSFYEITRFETTRNSTKARILSIEDNTDVEITLPDSYIVDGDILSGIVNLLTEPGGMLENGVFLTAEEYDLQAAKTAKFSQIKAQRINLEEGGLETSFGIVDSEPDSQRKISGGVQMALISLNTDITIDVDDGTGNTVPTPLGQIMFPEGLNIVWRFQDNTERLMLPEEMIQMGVETGKQVAKCQMMKNYLDAQVRSATTVAEVQAISVDFNWITYEIPA